MIRKRQMVWLCFVLALLLLAPQVEAKVTRVTASVSPPTYSGQCPKRFEFAGKITVDSPGIVEYKWIRSDGASAPIQKIRFEKAGTLTVNTYWELSTEGEHWQALQILSPNPITSARASFTLKCVTLGVVQLVNPMIIGTLLPVSTCPDIAAVEIVFQIIRRDSPFRGRIRITAVVKNITLKDFSSGPNQAVALLYQMPSYVPCSSATGGTVLVQKEIRTLAAGATIVLVYERDWDSSSPNEGEFPNCYRLMISLDPDIYLDGNPDNDDCSQNNNRVDRSGADINALFR
ncbi:MAG: hypothetical protein PHX90_03475 [Thermotogota bacterium]|nr:hypothetical protein [Thermotogota bacterium]MDD8053131.1 hypothetical protein [Thermotogota bacterium]HQC38406.1 hypothetical protein [Thermotogota bacterium]